MQRVNKMGRESKHKMKIGFVVAFVMLTFTCNADNPGYLGKKFNFSLGYSSIITYNSLISSAADPTSFEIRDLSNSQLRHVFDFRAERALSRSVAFMLNYARYGHQYKNEIGSDVYDVNGNGGFFSGYAISSQLKMSSISAGFKFFSQERGSIAPLGRYTALHFGSSTYSFSDVKIYEHESFGSNQFKNQFSNHSKSFNYNIPFFSVEVGKVRIIADQFSLNYFIVANFRLKKAENIEIKGLQGYPGSDSENFALGRVKNFNAAVNIIRFGFKLGYII